jgi:hypothetical protein
MRHAWYQATGSSFGEFFLMVRYFKCPWPERPVPDGEPMFILYEVEDVRDAVMRLIDVYADGRILKDSATKYTHDKLDVRNSVDFSLVQGDLLGDGLDKQMEEITEAEFAAAWEIASEA